MCKLLDNTFNWVFGVSFNWVFRVSFNWVFRVSFNWEFRVSFNWIFRVSFKRRSIAHLHPNLVPRLPPHTGYEWTKSEIAFSPFVCSFPVGGGSLKTSLKTRLSLSIKTGCAFAYKYFTYVYFGRFTMETRIQ